MNVTEDAKLKHFVMDWQWLIHPFGQQFPIEASPSSPPLRRNPEVIYLKNRERFSQEKPNVEELLRSWKSVDVANEVACVDHPARASNIFLPHQTYPGCAAVLQPADKTVLRKHTHLQ